MIVALAGPPKSGKTVVVEKVVGRDTLIAVQGTPIEGADDVWDRVLDWMETPAQRGAQIAFENYRALGFQSDHDQSASSYPLILAIALLPLAWIIRSRVLYAGTLLGIIMAACVLAGYQGSGRQLLFTMAAGGMFMSTLGELHRASEWRRQYRVIFGGGDAGSLTVQKYEAGMCGNLLAEVVAQTTARLGGEVPALAISSDKIGSGESSRRAPTEAERASALEVARAVYGRRRVGAVLIRKMNIVNLTATDIEHDGRFELIGTFQIDGANDLKHNLFIIFEPNAAGKYKAAWNWYENGYEDRKLVDVLDLDGDGTAEVIAEGFEIENNFYVIYKRQGGTWRPVYKGGGGGLY